MSNSLQQWINTTLAYFILANTYIIYYVYLLSLLRLVCHKCPFANIPTILIINFTTLLLSKLVKKTL